MKDPLELTSEELSANRDKEIDRIFNRLWNNGYGDSAEVKITLLAYLQLLLYWDLKEQFNK